MTRYEAMEFDTFSYNGDMDYIKESSVSQRIHQIYDELEDVKKENTRLKKQLSKDHHIKCSCSFCKPVDEKALKEFKFTSCDDCKFKIDGTYQEICSNCKRFYGCYFEKKDL